MRLVQDFVSVDSRGAFFNDVRLRDFYDKERNAELAANFIFTTTPRDQHDASSPYGTFDLLMGFVEGLTRESRENRYRIIATYGQGKSHYAVALANYFGQPIESAEWQAVIEQANKAANDGTSKSVTLLKSFREARKRPFLVLMLAGDGVEDLPTLLSEAVDTAIEYQGTSETPRLDLWFGKALEGVRRYADSDLEAANEYLAEYALDLEMLIDALERRLSVIRNNQTHELARGLVQHISGFVPDFGGAVDAGEVMRWVIETLCGEDGEFGGVVVIFDEFLSFVQGYVQRTIGAPLQRMAEAINDNPGKALLITFSQSDPSTYISDHAGAQGDLLKKEVNRIDTRRTMHSVLELVVGSYLQQDRRLWDQVFDEDEASSLTALVDTVSFGVLDVFGQRYKTELNWSTQNFVERVGVGCFPLHPGTTALFSSITWAQDQTARSTLQFVLQAAKSKLSQNAKVEGHPNWVMPFELVDYFEIMIGREVWESYSAARDRIGGSNSDPAVRVLKSVMLLQQTSLRFTSPRKYDEAVAVLLSAPVDAVQEQLSVLEGHQIIHRDPTGQCRLVHTDLGTRELNRAIDDAIKRLPEYSERDLEQYNHHLSAALSIEPGIQWKAGKPSDWGVQGEIMLARTLMDQGSIQSLLRAKTNARMAPVHPRFIWVVTRSEEELNWAQHQLPRLVAEKHTGANQAVVFIIPQGPSAAFQTSLDRLRAIESIPKSKKIEYGEELIRFQEGEAIRHLKDGWNWFTQDRKLIVPEYLNVTLSSLAARDLSEVLTRLYRALYPHHPDWLTTVDRNSNKLLPAIDTILEQISTDRAGELVNLTKVPAKNVVDYLRNWGIVEGGSNRLTDPRPHQTVARAWEKLDASVVVSGKPATAGELLDSLLASPFGFDTNLAPLILVSWLSASRDVSIIVNKSRSNLTGTVGSLKRRYGSELFKALDSMYLERRSETDTDRLLDDALKAFRGGNLTTDRASEVLIQLEEIVGDDTTAPNHAKEARKLHEEVSNDLTVALNLLDGGTDFLARSKRDLTDVRGLVKMSGEAARLVSPNKIKVDPDMLPAQLSARLFKTAEEAAMRVIKTAVTNVTSLADCERAEKVVAQTVEEFTGYRTSVYQNAEEWKNTLENRRRNILAATQDKAIALVVAAHRTALKSRASESTLREIVDGYTDATTYSPSMQRDIANLQQSARDQLRKIVSEISHLPDKVAQLKSTDEIVQFLGDLDALELRLSSSEWKETVAAAADQAETLREVLGEVQKHLTAQRTRPDEFHTTIEKLTKIANSGKLAFDSHRDLVLSAARRVETDLQKRISSAADDVESIGVRLKDGRLKPLDATHLLSRESPFLSAQANELRIELLNKATEMMNSNYVESIVNMFAKITSHEERGRLLRELQARL